MKLKRISAIVLALAMTASLAAFAAAAEGGDYYDVEVDDLVIREVNHDQGDISLLSGSMLLPGGLGIQIPLMTTTSAPVTYATTATITVNGEEVTSYTYDWQTEEITATFGELPVVDPGYIPLRAVTQADGGYVYWDQGNHRSWFNLGNYRIVTDFSDMSITIGLDNDPLEGVSAVLIEGVTFIPASVIDSLEGFEVVHTSADGVEHYEIKTPNGAPVITMAKALQETAHTGIGEKADLEILSYVYGDMGFNEEVISECTVFFPASTNANTLMLIKLTDVSKREEIKAAFEAYQAYQMERCNWGYLEASQPAIENAKMAFEGDWALFIISLDGEAADAAVAQFATLVAELV